MFDAESDIPASKVSATLPSDGFAFPVIVFVKSGRETQGEGFVLCYGPNSFYLVDRNNNSVATLSNRAGLASVHLPGFLAGREHLQLMFDSGPVEAIADRQHQRHLQLFVEHELAKESPEVLQRWKQRAFAELGLGVFLVLLGIVTFVATLEDFAVVLRGAAAAGIALVVRSSVQWRRLHRISRRATTGDTTDLDLAERFLPEPSAVFSLLDDLLTQHRAEDRHIAVAGGSTLLAFVTLVVSALVFVYVGMDSRHPAKPPLAPERPAVVRLEQPASPFQLPDNWNQMAILGENSEFVDLEFKPQAVMYGWWVGRNTELRFGDSTIPGFSLEDPPYKEWSADLLANPATANKSYQPVKPTVRFERPPQGWPETASPVEYEAAMSLVTPEPERGLLLLTQREMSQSGQVWILDDARMKQFVRYQSDVKQHAQSKAGVVQFNTQADTYNQHLTQEKLRIEARRSRLWPWLLIVSTLAAISVLIPVVLMRPFRAAFHVAIAFLSVGMQWAPWPEEVSGEPIEKIELTAET